MFSYIRKKPLYILLIILSGFVSLFVIIGSSFLKHKYINLEKKITDSFCRVKKNFAEDYILAFIAVPLTAFLYLWNSFKNKNDHCSDCAFFKERELLIKKEKYDSVYGKLKLFFLYIVFCSCGLELPIPMNPFSKNNRLLTSVIFAAYIYNISKIFQFSIFGPESTTEYNLNDMILYANKTVSGSLNKGSYKKMFKNVKSIFKNEIYLSNDSNTTLSDYSNETMPNYYESHFNNFQSFIKEGMLLNLVVKVCNVFIIGLLYYPILLCVEFKKKAH